MKRIVKTLLLMVCVLVFSNMPVKAADSINFAGFYEKNDTSVVVTFKVDKGGAVSGQFDMSYDTTKVELVKAEAGEAFGEAVLNSVNTATAGTITVGFAGETGITSGTLLVAEFKALTDDALTFPVTVKEWSAKTHNDLLAEAKTIELTEKKVTALTATKTTTAYEVGDTLKTEDLNVTATYEDGTSKAVTDYKVDTSKIDMNTAGDKTITVSYEGVTAKVKITVKAHTVKFDANGGTKLSKDSITVSTHKGKIGTLPTVVRKDYDFKGWYTKKSGGTQITANTKIEKSMTVYAQWTKTAAPGKGQTPTLSSKKNGQITVSYKAVSKAKGYQITYSTSKLFTSKKTNSVLAVGKSKTITKLETGKTYYVKVRAYVLDSAGNKVYGAYSKVQNITLAPGKANTPTLSNKKSGKLTVSYKKVDNASGYEIVYSTNKNFTKATTKTKKVTKTSATLTNLKKGKTYYVKVRAYAKNTAKKEVYGAYSTSKSIKVK